MTEKLFMVYLGGSAPGANIELHDIRFVAGETIEATYAQLKRQWFGSKQSVHMDSYVQLYHVDGYRIELKRQGEPGTGAASVSTQKKLYFVNFGAYFPGKMAEYHDFTLVVAVSAEDAKAQARHKVLQGSLGAAEQFHKDDLVSVDDCLAVDLIDGFNVELIEDGQQQLLEPDWMGYRPLP